MANRHAGLVHWQWAFVALISFAWILTPPYGSAIEVVITPVFWYGVVRLLVYLNYRWGEQEETPDGEPT